MSRNILENAAAIAALSAATLTPLHSDADTLRDNLDQSPALADASFKQSTSPAVAIATITPTQLLTVMRACQKETQAFLTNIALKFPNEDVSVYEFDPKYRAFIYNHADRMIAYGIIVAEVLEGARAPLRTPNFNPCPDRHSILAKEINNARNDILRETHISKVAAHTVSAPTPLALDALWKNITWNSHGADWSATVGEVPTQLFSAVSMITFHKRVREQTIKTFMAQPANRNVQITEEHLPALPDRTFLERVTMLCRENLEVPINTFEAGARLNPRAKN